MSDTRYDALVVGGGAAGMSAALAAASQGARVALIDEHDRPGGPIWRAGAASRPPRRAQSLVAAMRADSRIDYLPSHTVVDARRRSDGDPESRLAILDNQRADGSRWIRAPKLILATGSVERFLPFPGWTLPGVTGVGGLQALVKGGLPVTGRRVLVAGSGPLTLALAALLRQRGAEVRGPFEQAAGHRVRGFLGRLALRYPDKLIQAAGLAWTAGKLQGPTTSRWIERVEPGTERTLRAHVTGPRGGVQSVEADYVACAFGLAPRIELAALLGCALGEANGVARAQVDHRLESVNQNGIHCAGELVGIAGVDSALAEGHLAGLAAFGAETESASRAARKARRFGELLEQTFSPRPEVLRLATDETIVCRCEDVSWSAVHGGPPGQWATHQASGFFGVRDAKLKTRCGMGVCQGKVCGPLLQSILGWSRDNVRAPLAPVPMYVFADLAEQSAAMAADR